MSEDEGLSREQKVFNKCVDFGEAVLDKGIAKLWFSWIEWVGLTALLFLAFDKVGSIIALIAGLFSVVMLFFVFMAACKKVLVKKLDNETSNKWALLLSCLLVLIGPMLAFSLISSIILATNS